MLNKDTLPTVTEYMNYRQFLQDFYLSKKKENRSYSYRVFVKNGELGSPSHLKMVIDGSRNLTQSTITKYVKAIGFKKKTESQFFETLVKYNQEANADQKIEFFNELMSLKKKQGLSVLEKHQFDLLAHWFYVAIYVLTDLRDFRHDPEWISDRLRKKVTPKQVKETLEALLALRLIEPDPIKGYRQTSGPLSTAEDLRSLSAHQYHLQMIELSIESLKNDPYQVREFNGVTLKICEEKLPLLKEKIRQFRKEVNELTSNLEGPDQVYQLNIQLFPLTGVTQ